MGVNSLLLQVDKQQVPLHHGCHWEGGGLAVLHFFPTVRH